MLAYCFSIYWRKIVLGQIITFILALCQRFERCQNIKQKKDLVVNEIKGSFKKSKAK